MEGLTPDPENASTPNPSQPIDPPPLPPSITATTTTATTTLEAQNRKVLLFIDNFSSYELGV